jgi:hypothetical protein
MKRISEVNALRQLQDLKNEYAAEIRERYEHKAKSCDTCEAKGACCLDAHFVNVHITRLEAAAVVRVLSSLPNTTEVYARIEGAIAKYGLAAEGDSFAKTYACPLFESAAGCLVHLEGKPLPCITHACYEKKEDLPPDELQQQREREVELLNRKVYRRSPTWTPLPIAIMRSSRLID